MPKKTALRCLFFLDALNAALHYQVRMKFWFFILPCDWRFLPELGPPPYLGWRASFFRASFRGFFPYFGGVAASIPAHIDLEQWRR
jgi:hypothetical protein